MTGHPPREVPRVFISYTHDSDEHRGRALRLTERLRSLWIDAWIDQYVEDDPPHSWPIWMHKEIAKADFVIMICTRRYQLRVQDEEEPGKGRGALWEGAMITHSLYHSQKFSEPSPYIPVVFKADDLQHLPYFVSGASYYVVDVETGQGIDPMVRRMLHEPAVVPHPLGQPLMNLHRSPAHEYPTLAREYQSSAREASVSAPARRRGAKPAAIGSALRRGVVTLPPALQDATFQALSRVADPSSKPPSDVVLLDLRQIAARFSEALPAAYGPANVSLWQMLHSTDDVQVQSLLSTGSDGIRRASPPVVGLSNIDLFQGLIDLDATGRSQGIVDHGEDGTARAAWLIATPGHHGLGQTVFGFLAVKTSEPLSRHFRMMGQRVADRLVPVFQHINARQPD
ncbi:toll/interleukin-1 receptor domain-containing protein [Blastococcus sp. SYSU DS0669]